MNGQRQVCTWHKRRFVQTERRVSMPLSAQTTGDIAPPDPYSDVAASMGVCFSPLWTGAVLPPSINWGPRPVVPPAVRAMG
eukprot:CAMPEP_0174371470 /NCGR_PEP_ID=MMETSP0811_2-20130205/99877_1 /TAXON_ID=73025 ORGANISM="Eutreptiella gymnastica-like, Strain CCMP1594" /NCGR_SAMPLE_ID=MMETSP0811_2 /ASSEMBLY_ACC=CAM_ASM_000667 /LENGTH=80 /DNA_ID=CAMNT_0015517873 /DNA_START=556 /DNA_END=798 /DNA_ORIENTATION=+